MSEDKARAIGINHVALEVADIDAVRAVEFIEPDVVIPCHYDTWPRIEQDAAAFAAAVGDRAQVQVMTPNALFEF